MYDICDYFLVLSDSRGGFRCHANVCFLPWHGFPWGSCSVPLCIFCLSTVGTVSVRLKPSDLCSSPFELSNSYMAPGLCGVNIQPSRLILLYLDGISVSQGLVTCCGSAEGGPLRTRQEALTGFSSPPSGFPRGIHLLRCCSAVYLQDGSVTWLHWCTFICFSSSSSLFLLHCPHWSQVPLRVGFALLPSGVFWLSRPPMLQE